MPHEADRIVAGGRQPLRLVQAAQLGVRHRRAHQIGERALTSLARTVDKHDAGVRERVVDQLVRVARYQAVYQWIHVYHGAIRVQIAAILVSR